MQIIAAQHSWTLLKFMVSAAVTYLQPVRKADITNFLTKCTNVIVFFLYLQQLNLVCSFPCTRNGMNKLSRVWLKHFPRASWSSMFSASERPLKILDRIKQVSNFQINHVKILREEMSFTRPGHFCNCFSAIQTLIRCQNTEPFQSHIFRFSGNFCLQKRSEN